MTNKPESSLKIYWNAYGGCKALFQSKYFIAAIVITILCSVEWINNQKWIEIGVASLPSLLGFALGGYAIWLSAGDEKLKKILYKSGQTGSVSSFIQVNATFVHFILLQILSLVYLYILKFNSAGAILKFLEQYWLFKKEVYCFLYVIKFIFHFLGFLLYIYSILAMLAAVFSIFRIARWTDRLNSKESIVCDECKEEVKPLAKKCKHCGAIFTLENDQTKPS